MDKCNVEDFLSKEYTQLNIGRASPLVLDSISVESYGSYVPLKNIASVSFKSLICFLITTISSLIVIVLGAKILFFDNLVDKSLLGIIIVGI